MRGEEDDGAKIKGVMNKKRKLAGGGRREDEAGEGLGPAKLTMMLKQSSL